MRKILVVALGAALLMGCGGGSGRTATVSVSDTPTAQEATATPPDPVLHLPGGDTTESAFRTKEQSILLSPGAIAWCQGIRGLSDAEVFAAIIASVPNPAPDRSPTDDQRAAAIAKEECARILNGN